MTDFARNRNRAAVIRRILRASETAPGPEAALWTAIGRTLAAEGQTRGANEAFSWALELDPLNVTAKRAWRQTRDRDVTLPPEAAGELGRRVAARLGLPKDAALVLRTSDQILSGLGANTEYVARHRFGGDADWAVLEKRYRKTPGETPREVAVYRQLDRIPQGRFYRFPGTVWIDESDDRVSIFMDYVQASRPAISLADELEVKARALGEFAGLTFALGDFSFLPPAPAPKRPKVTGLVSLEPYVSQAAFDELRDRISVLFSQRRGLLAGRHPECLVKGDAQSANMIFDADKRIVFIDNGRLQAGMPGADLAHLLWGVLIRDPEAMPSVERSVLEAFHAAGNLGRERVTMEDVVRGYGCELARLVYMRILRPVQTGSVSPVVAASLDLQLINGVLNHTQSALAGRLPER